MKFQLGRKSGDFDHCLTISQKQYKIGTELGLLMKANIGAYRRQKSVTMTVSLERSRKEDGIDHTNPYVYLS